MNYLQDGHIKSARVLAGHVAAGPNLGLASDPRSGREIIRMPVARPRDKCPLRGQTESQRNSVHHLHSAPV